MARYPNAYFYSYTSPGETQKMGPWESKEHSRFMAQVEAFGGW